MGRDGTQRSEMGGNGMTSMVSMMVSMVSMMVSMVKARCVAGAERLENIKVLRKVLSSRVDNLLVVFEGVDGNE